MERTRNEMVRKERLYAIGCLLAGILMFGTAGAMENNIITFVQGVWQIIWAIILGLWCCNGIRLEETRSARRRW